MITPQTYVDAICARLSGKFPDDPHAPYQHFMPQDFERPSLFVACQNVNFQPHQLEAADTRLTFVIEGYTPVDAYHHASLEDLYTRMMTVCGAFIGGKIPLTDPEDGHKRAANVLSCEGACDPDFCRVLLKTSLFMDRSEFETIPEGPLMQDIRTVFKA